MQEWIGKVKAVGFDVDGTLYHAPKELEEFFGEKLRQEIFEELAEKLGVNLVEAEKIYWRKKNLLGSNTATMESFGFDGERFFQELFDQFPLEKYLEKDERLVKMLAELEEDYRLFLISNGTGKQVRRKLKLLGIEEDWFESFVTCYDYGWVKPQLEPFLKVTEEMGLEPNECLYVGDRCETDAVGAKNAGMRVAIIGRECGEADVKLDSVYGVERLFSVHC